MKIQQAIDLIEAYAPLHLQADYDNAGLLCGDPSCELTSALLCIDVTEAVIDEAIRGGHNLVISHHPLVFRGIKSLTPRTYIERCLLRAILHHVAIYAAHTNMDATPGGVSHRMADRLGLVDRLVLQPRDPATPDVGFGIVGNLPAPVPAMEFLHHLKHLFHCPSIRHTHPHLPVFRRVALCGGAGADLLPLAIRAGADIYISADFKYHDFFLPDGRLTIADIGHYESEQFTKDIFLEILTKKIPTFALQISTINTNPIKYL